jgi:hypothetical protein
MRGCNSPARAPRSGRAWCRARSKPQRRRPSRRSTVRSSATAAPPAPSAAARGPTCRCPRRRGSAAPARRGRRQEACRRHPSGYRWNGMAVTRVMDQTGRPTTKRAPSGSEVSRHRSGGCSRPRSRRHAPRRSAWRSPGQGRNCCRNAFRALGIEPLKILVSACSGMPGPVSSTTTSTRLSRLRAQTRIASPSSQKRDRVGDQVDEDLRQPRLQPV